MIVVAMPSEIALIKNINEPILVTGVGAVNIINALKDINRDTPIVNIGYAGSNSLKIGSCVSVGEVHLLHPNATYAEQSLDKLNGDIPCYTSCDFVTETDIVEPCVFDMELAFILALGFKNVSALKVVSDNLNMEEFEECLKK